MEKSETENKVALPNFKNMSIRGGIALFLKCHVCNLDILLAIKHQEKEIILSVFLSQVHPCLLEGNTGFDDLYLTISRLDDCILLFMAQSLKTIQFKGFRTFCNAVVQHCCTNYIQT